MSVYKKLSDFHKEAGKIRKDASNPFHKSKYATIESVLQTIQEPMQNVGLGFSQMPQAEGLKTIIFDVEGDSMIESFVPYVLAKQDMQGLGSAITYCRRYALVSMLGLEQEDDDANATVKQPDNNNQRNKNIPQNLSDWTKQQGIDKKEFYAFANVKSADDAAMLYADKGALSDMLTRFKETNNA